MKRSMFILIILFFLVSCGFVEETEFLPNVLEDSIPPLISSVVPVEGSKIDTLSQVEITFSESVTGANTAGNYALGGTGAAGLSISSVTESGVNTYTVFIAGTPGDGPIDLTVSNIADTSGNVAPPSTISYIGWWDTDWQHRRILTFDNSGRTEDLQNFPVLVRLNSTRVDYNATQDNGEDIRFLDSDRTVLSYEIEEWDESGDSVVWVNVPQIDRLSDTDFIWIYYANSSIGDGQDPLNVWDADFVMVWHLNDQPTSTGGDYDISDSLQSLPSPNYGNGISVNMGAGNKAQGYIGGGISFNGSNQWLNLDSPDPGFFHDAFSNKTFEAWVKTNNTSVLQTIYEEGGSTNGFYVGINSNLIRVATRDGGTQREVSSAYTSTTTFQYVAGVFDSGQLSLHFNGGSPIAISTGYTSISTHSGEPGFGYSPDSDAVGTGPGEYFNGILDELRLSGTARSDDWISAQYASMSGSFITYGSEE